jgi:excisionase family DNA binding protein
LKQKPEKMVYSLKEAAEILCIGQEFLRRRIKSGKINVVRLGDKPAINLVELARILSEGV